MLKGHTDSPVFIDLFPTKTLGLSVPTMGLGILEPHVGDTSAQVPGTATLLHDDDENIHGISKNRAIILVPRPSDSLRDPLVRR